MIAKLIAVAALGLAAAVAGICTWANLTASSQPEQVLAVFPDHAMSIEALTQKRIEAAHGSVTLAVLALGPHALRREPLSRQPLAVAALSSSATSNRAVTQKLFVAALKRDPRNRIARLWLAQAALGAGDFASVLGNLERLVELDAPRGEAYLDAIASLADSGGKAVLEARLKGNPFWAEAIVGRLNRSSKDIGFLLRINDGRPRNQEQLLQRLAQERGLNSAFIAWAGLLPADEVARFSWPYDPDFKQRKAPPPFNWSIRSDQAEFEKVGGLAMTYLGRSTPVLIEQTIMLRPGAYVFEAVMDGESQKSGGAFGWRVQCLADGREIGSIKIEGLTEKASKYGFAFEVPAGCDAQKLIMRGEPGEFPLWAHSTTHSVAIRAQGKT